MHVTDGCKVLISEAKKLKQQHAAGSDAPQAKTCIMHHNIMEKYLNALIVTIVSVLKSQRRKVDFLTLRKPASMVPQRKAMMIPCQMNSRKQVGE